MNEKLADFCIWMIYIQLIHWLILINIPYFIIISPILNIISFHFMHFTIKYLYSKATEPASDIGWFLMVLMNLTLWAYILSMGLWYIFPRDHNCGPIPNGQYAWYPMEQKVNDRPILDALYTVGTFYPILWNLASILVLITMFNRNKGKVYKLYIKAKNFEYQNIIKDQVNHIQKIKKRLEFQRVLEVS